MNIQCSKWTPAELLKMYPCLQYNTPTTSWIPQIDSSLKYDDILKKLKSEDYTAILKEFYPEFSVWQTRNISDKEKCILLWLDNGRQTIEYKLGDYIEISTLTYDLDICNNYLKLYLLDIHGEILDINQKFGEISVLLDCISCLKYDNKRNLCETSEVFECNDAAVIVLDWQDSLVF